MSDSEQAEDTSQTIDPQVTIYSLERSIVMVGLMGAGKSSVGRGLAARFNLPFVDADTEIEAAAGCTISEFFERHGEAEFRDGERRVIARLLEGSPKVLATGGGAFMDDETRTAITAMGISVWLRADLSTLVRRTAQRTNRPLLNNANPARTLEDLMEIRYPFYAQADITVESDDSPPNVTVERVVNALENFLETKEASSTS
ncbi:MAG: shikimate kinase [Alphaproteobacteria bacterium]|nr:shikimate kinase [Alphaproteobacteria bacterium]HCP00805.1 shikimate kinase [Rhodospirillaceae bacterium]